MKKLITICVGLIVAGCATTSQLEETKGQLAAADTKIQDLEKRLARIEGDLYRVEVKSAPKVEKPEPPKPAEPKFVPAKEVEKKVVDAKIDAFLKEYLGVQFGDSIDKFPEEKQDANPDTRRGGLLISSRFRRRAGEQTVSTDKRNIPVLKKFKYFDKAYVEFGEGKLYNVVFLANIDKKYSLDSINEKVNQAIADLAVTLGLESTAFKNSLFYTSNPLTSYSLSKSVGSNGEDFWVCEVSFRDSGLWNRIAEEKRKAEEEARLKKNAEGETLPDPE